VSLSLHTLISWLWEWCKTESPRNVVSNVCYINPHKQLNIKQVESIILGSACYCASLYITILKCTTLIQATGICVGKPKLCYTTICDCTNILDISLVLSTLLNWLSSESTVRLQLLVCGKLHCHSGNYSLPLQRRYIEICIILWFYIQLLMSEAGKERDREMLHSTLRENLWYKYEWLARF